MSLPVREVWIEIRLASVNDTYTLSLPVREVWIEIAEEHHAALPFQRHFP